MDTLTIDGIRKGSSNCLPSLERNIKSKERSISKSLEKGNKSHESSDDDFINRSRTLDVQNS